MCIDRKGKLQLARRPPLSTFPKQAVLRFDRLNAWRLVIRPHAYLDRIIVQFDIDLLRGEPGKF